MSLNWFRPPTPSGETLAEKLERLRPLGVRWRSWGDQTQPHATYAVRDGVLVKDVGILVVPVRSQTIDVYPFAGISYAEMLVLAGCAQRAFERSPRRADGWTRLRTKRLNRWQVHVMVRANEGNDLVAQQVAHADRNARDSVLDHAFEITQALCLVAAPAGES